MQKSRGRNFVRSLLHSDTTAPAVRRSYPPDSLPMKRIQFIRAPDNVSPSPLPEPASMQNFPRVRSNMIFGFLTILNNAQNSMVSSLCQISGGPASYRRSTETPDSELIQGCSGLCWAKLIRTYRVSAASDTGENAYFRNGPSASSLNFALTGVKTVLSGDSSSWNHFSGQPGLACFQRNT